MRAGILPSRVASDAASGDRAVRTASELLRALVVALGVGWSLLFVVVGLGYGLQMYGDGAIFSYGVAVRDLWAFHWHNLSGRLFVDLFSHLPAQLYVALTRDPRGGIVVFGLLFFVAPLLGLAATFVADRSKSRVIFGYACASTACFCPLVFGFVTEMWIAHAVFWPALAVSHYARRGFGGVVAVFLLLLALAFSHEAAVVLAAAIPCTLALRGLRDPAFLRAAGAFLIVAAIWAAVKTMLPPDAYYVGIFDSAALHFFDIARLIDDPLLRLLAGALALYGIAFCVLRRLAPTTAQLWAAALVAVALAVYWLWFDHALHTYYRYFLRTVLFAATLGLGGLAALYALRADGRALPPVALLPRLMAAFTADIVVQAVVGAVLLLTLVHAVETAKFVTAWTPVTRTGNARRSRWARRPIPRFSAIRISSRRRASIRGSTGWRGIRPRPTCRSSSRPISRRRGS